MNDEQKTALEEKLERLSKIAETTARLQRLTKTIDSLQYVKELRIKPFGLEGFDSTGNCIMSTQDISLMEVIKSISDKLDSKVGDLETELADIVTDEEEWDRE